MKIGIITYYYHNYNYGGCLQAYALTNFLNSKGFQAKQISYFPIVERNFFKKMIHFIQRGNLKNKFKKNNFNKKILSQDIKNHFDEFCADMIPHTHLVNEKDIINLNKDFDVFISGGDQIWNPISFRETYFLNFANNDKLKLSYSPSIAVDKLTLLEKIKYKKLLSNYNYISIRETTGQKILEEILKKPVFKVLDPVFLLSYNQWKEISSDRIIDGKYIFVYILGNRTDINLKINEYAKHKSLDIVYIPEISPNIFGNKPVFNIGPTEFISLIQNACLVITDSFHALSFSLIFNTPFAIINRILEKSKNDTMSRLRDFLIELNLNPKFGGKNFEIDDIINNDNEYLKKLNELRHYSIEYLLNSLLGEK